MTDDTTTTSVGNDDPAKVIKSLKQEIKDLKLQLSDKDRKIRSLELQLTMVKDSKSGGSAAVPEPLQRRQQPMLPPPPLPPVSATSSQSFNSRPTREIIYDKSVTISTKPAQYHVIDGQLPVAQPPKRRQQQPAIISEEFIRKQQQYQDDLNLDPDLIESYSGLRLLKRDCPDQHLKDNMNGRKYLPLSHIKSKIDRITNDIEDDWVTIGVLAERTTPKTSANGSKYIIFKLTDLNGTYVNVFMFGDIFEKFWRENIVGEVVGILNPKLLPPTEANALLGLNVDLQEKILFIGTSRDLGMCKAKRKDGEPCTNYVNKRQTELCEYHIVSKYQKSRENRQEFATGTAGLVLGNPKMKNAISTAAIIKQQTNPRKGPSGPTFAGTISSSTFSRNKQNDSSHYGTYRVGTTMITVDETQHFDQTGEGSERGKTKLVKPIAGKSSAANDRALQALLMQGNIGAKYLARAVLPTSPTATTSKTTNNAATIAIAQNQAKIAKSPGSVFSSTALVKMGFDPFSKAGVVKKEDEYGASSSSNTASSKHDNGGKKKMTLVDRLGMSPSKMRKDGKKLIKQRKEQQAAAKAAAKAAAAQKKKNLVNGQVVLEFDDSSDESCEDDGGFSRFKKNKGNDEDEGDGEDEDVGDQGEKRGGGKSLLDKFRDIKKRKVIVESNEDDE